MKSGYKLVRGGVVLGIMVVIFSFLWQKDPELANSHITAVRFAFFRMMAIVAGCSVLIAWLGRRHFSISLLDWGVLVFAGYVWTLYLMGGMVGYRVRLTVLLVVLYFVFRLLASLYSRAGRVMQSVFLLVVVVECVYGFLQLYGWASSGHALYRLTGSFFNPGPYSCFLAVGLCMAFNRIMDARGKRVLRRRPWHGKMAFLQGELLVAWICFVLTLVLLPAGMSRSSWLAAAVGCGIVAGQHGILEQAGSWVATHRRQAVGWLIAGSIFLLLAGGGVYALKKDSADGRLFIWKISLLAMREHPWTGVGLGYFSGAYGQAQADWFASGKATPQEEKVAGVPEYGFNEYLQLGVELGGIGLLLFLFVLVIAFWQLFRVPSQKGVAGGLGCWLVFAWFSYPLSILPLSVVLVLLLALSSSGFAGQPSGGQWRSVGIAFGCLLLAVANIPWNKQWREAYANWHTEQTYFNMKIYEGTVDHYTRLYPLLQEEPRFLFEYGQCLAQTGQYDESTRILQEATALSGDPMFYNIMGKNEQAMKRYQQAESYFGRAALIVPHRLYPLYLLACFYWDTGQDRKAREVSTQLLQKEPKVMSDAVREMKEELENRLGVNK